MKLAFLGTSDFAVPALSALVDAGHEVIAVYTRAPKPAGRGQRERRTPVHELALSLALPVRTPSSLKSDEEALAFEALDLDAAVVVAYGHILPRRFLEAPVLGCINIHGSLLPRWRGAAPIHRAILAGDAETGVTTMRMDEGLDTGPMLLAERTPISAADTAETVHDRLAELGARLIVSTLDGLVTKAIEPVPQSEAGVTYAHKLGKDEGALDWRRPAAELERKVRAFHPWPGTWFDVDTESGNERIKVLAAGLALASGAPGTVSVGRDGFPVVACGIGGLKLLQLQRAGKSAQSADAFLRGFALATVLAPPAIIPLPTSTSCRAKSVTRYKLTIEYDGGPFVGWQRQDNGPSIQAAIERAVLAMSGERVTLQGAGRTDAGVHALGQVAHFDLASEKPAETVRAALNFHLKPDPIAIIEAEIVPADFNARFSATTRRYRYLILNRRAPPAFDRGHVWHVPVPLDVELMADAASVLRGHHDFNSFRATSCQAPSSIKTLELFEVTRLGDQIRIDAGSRSFLHNQVRILVGTLALVGRGQWSRHDVEEALAARDRTRAGPTAPPHGLCLMEVRYDLAAGDRHDTEIAVDEE